LSFHFLIPFNLTSQFEFAHRAQFFRANIAATFLPAALWLQQRWSYAQVAFFATRISRIKGLREYTFDNHRGASRTKFCKTTHSAPKPHYEHQRQGGIFATGTAGDCAAGERATTQELVAKLGVKKPVVLNYIHFCYIKAGGAGRSESEDAGIL